MASFKVIENATIRQIIYDFLSVCRCSRFTLSCTIFEMCDVEKYRDLEIPGIFLALTVCVTVQSVLQSELRKEAICYCRSRSFKVIGVGTSRKPVCDFLLVFLYNCRPTLQPVREITIYWSKVDRFHRFLTPVSFKALARGVLVEPKVWKSVSNN